MAVYSCSVKPITRSQGHSIVAASAYRARRKMSLEITGESWDYSRKKDLIASAMLLPNKKMAKDPEKIWNQLEKKETRKADGLVKATAELGREIRIALPRELSNDQNTQLTEAYCRQLAEKYCCVVEYGIHNDKENNNPHAHILISSREYEPNKGFGNKVRSLSAYNTRKLELEYIKKSLADFTNEALERNSFKARVDHRSLEAQQTEAEAKGDLIKALELSREPTKHTGRNPAKAKKNIAFNFKVKADKERREERLVNKIELDITKQLKRTHEAAKVKIVKQRVKKPSIFEQASAVFLNFLQIDFFGIEKREKQKAKEKKEREADNKKQEEIKQYFAKLNKTCNEKDRLNSILRQNSLTLGNKLEARNRNEIVSSNKNRIKRRGPR